MTVPSCEVAFSRAFLAWAALLLPVSCAGPPLTFYTLAGAPPALPEVSPGKQPVVISVARVAIPDELDNEDLVVRDGSILLHSRTGRWATRLSLGITDRLTARLAEHWPGAVVTDRPLTDTVSYRVLVNISGLDMDDTGVTTLEADWQIVPVDQARPVTLSRTRFNVTGPVANNQDVVRLTGQVTDRLAEAIEASGLDQMPRLAR